MRLPSGEAITLQIWDTAGQERFRAMAPLYYRGAKAAIVVFDLTVRETFDQAKNWVDELRRFVSPGCQLFLAANKADKVESGGELQVVRDCGVRLWWRFSALFSSFPGLLRASRGSRASSFPHHPQNQSLQEAEEGKEGAAGHRDRHRRELRLRAEDCGRTAVPPRSTWKKPRHTRRR